MPVKNTGICILSTSSLHSFSFISQHQHFTMSEFGAREVAQHKSPDDAWIIIHGKGKFNSLCQLRLLTVSLRCDSVSGRSPWWR